MEHKSVIDEEFVKRLCCGKPEAISFFLEWYAWVHGIDDLIDEGLGSGVPGLEPAEARQRIVNTFAQAVVVLSHPFYVKHVDALRMTAVLVANRYADTVNYEYADKAESWQKQWADHHRGVAMEMAMAVALICGGWAHARSLSQELVELCY